MGRVTKEEKRVILKAHGWRRCDHSNVELWMRPWDGIGYQPMSVMLESAWRRLMGIKRKKK